MYMQDTNIHIIKEILICAGWLRWREDEEVDWGGLGVGEYTGGGVGVL
jgi:hypothetical protein